MPLSRASELAQIISINTLEIEEYLAKKGLPALSFNTNPDFQLHEHSQVARQRQAILNATEELNSLVLGPKGILTSQPVNYWTAIQATYRFRLATKFPANVEEMTFPELATATGFPEGHIKRIFRYLMTFHIFEEPRKGVVAHTAASKLLASDSLTRQWIGMVSEEIWPSTIKFSRAIRKWPESEEPNNSAFNIAHHTQATFFEAISEERRREKRYAAAMTFSSAWPGLEVEYVLGGFKWFTIGTGTVVDIGGSHGSLSIALADRYPNLKLVVQEQAAVVREGLAKLPRELASRVTFMVHDFFNDQPILDAEVYVLRWILHDWSDKYAIRILRALTPALKDGAKILVMEQVMPQPGSFLAFQERGMRSFDLSMWAVHNAKERDIDEWRQLFESADIRFELTAVRRPAGSRLSSLEITWRPGRSLSSNTVSGNLGESS